MNTVCCYEGGCVVERLVDTLACSAGVPPSARSPSTRASSPSSPATVVCLPATLSIQWQLCLFSRWKFQGTFSCGFGCLPCAEDDRPLPQHCHRWELSQPGHDKAGTLGVTSRKRWRNFWLLPTPRSAVSRSCPRSSQSCPDRGRAQFSLCAAWSLTGRTTP